MKILLWTGLMAVAGQLLAAPTISNVTTTQASGSRKVEIAYRLTGADAVVTVDVRTNRGDGVYASIGDSHLRFLQGDVNRKIAAGDTTRKIYWFPDNDWLEGGAVADIKATVKAWELTDPPDYLAIDLEVMSNVVYYTSVAALPKSIDDDCWRTRYLLMRKIPAKGVVWTRGKYQVTSGASKQHLVQLTHNYYLGVFEVTQYQANKVTGGWDSDFSAVAYRDTRPASNQRWLWVKDRATFFGPKGGFATGFSLPTDAQWEFAARAGEVHEYTDGNDPADTTDANLEKLARYSGNAGSGYDKTTCDTTVGTARVGSYEPNAFGLYDMLGNVSECVLDCFSWDGWKDYGTTVYVDPTGPASHSSGGERSTRGGSYLGDAKTCTLGNNQDPAPYYGTEPVAKVGYRVCYTLDD